MSARHGVRRHFGDWLSIHAHAERVPPRLTLTVTFGELPEGWARPTDHARTWAATIGLLLITPFVIAVTAGVLSSAGYAAPYVWLSSSSPAILAAGISLFVGIPVAVAMNLWRVARAGIRRDTGALDGLLALEFAPLHLAVLAAAILLGGAFLAHLAADSYACLNGVRSAC